MCLQFPRTPSVSSAPRNKQDGSAEGVTHTQTVHYNIHVYTIQQETFEEENSQDQIFCMGPVALPKNRVWTIEELVPVTYSGE